MRNKIIGIYKITNTVNNKFYIGSSTNCNKRFVYHKNDLRNNKHHSFKLQNAWNKYKEDSFTFEIIEQCAVEILISREQFYLNLFKPPYNNCKIAGSPVGLTKSKEQLLKRIKKNQNKGTGHFYRSIKQFDKKGSFIKEWKSIREAAYNLKIRESIISLCCKKGCKTAGGYIWQYLEDNSPLNLNLKRESPNKRIKIKQYDLNGDFIKDWNSISECKNELGINSFSSISNNLKGLSKTCNRFIFKYN